MSSLGFSCSANGRSFAALSISTVSASTSTVPVFSLSLAVIRARTMPVTRRQYFVADLAGDGKRLAIRALDDHLRQPLVIAQVDKSNVRLQAQRVHPATQADGLADQRLVNEAAIVRAHALETPGRRRGMNA